MLFEHETISEKVSFFFKKGSFAVIDQGLFSGANFIVNVMLARWLEPSQYGAFAIAFSVLLLLVAFHNAVLTEPMMVFGAGRYSEHFNVYLGRLVFGHLGLMVPIAFIIGATALTIGHFYTREVQGALFGLAVAGPTVSLLWLVRRAFYVRLQPVFSALGGVFYLVCLLGGIYLLRTTHWLSQTTAFLAIGLSSVLVSFLLLIHLRPRWVIAGNPAPLIVAKQHWRYGRWALGTAGLIWFPSNIYFLLLPSIIGLSGIAAFRALINLALPIQHVVTAFSVLLLPVFSQTLKTKGISNMYSHMRFFLILFLISSGLYYLMLLTFKIQIFKLLYANQYIDFSYLVPIIALFPFGASITGILGNALRAMERSDKVFLCYIVSSAIALGGGISLAITLGVKGALYGLLISSFATGTMMSILHINLYKGRKDF